MSCERYGSLLHGYADGELDVANVIEIEEHLASCRSCHESLADLQLVRASLASSRLGYEAPQRLRRQIDKMTSTNSRGSLARWTAPAFSAALAASLALLLVPRPGGVRLEQELVESHVRSLLADHLIDVATTSEHVVRPWFNGRIDFAPRVPELADQGFELIGGRLDYVGDRVVPAIVYRRRRHAVNLFVWPQAAERPEVRSIRGYAIVEWSEGRLRYAAVSDVGIGELTLFQRAFVQSGHAPRDPEEGPGA